MFTISPCTRRAAQCLAVVCGLATMSMALPAWADRPSTAVTVVNPTTSPVPATVVNPTDSPVPTTDVNNPALQPFQINLLPHSPTSSQATDTYTVPAGKRLVIEYYSSQAQDISGGAAGLTLLTTAGGKTVSYIVYVDANTTNQVNQTARIYADPSSIVEAFAFNGGGAHSCAGFLSISGYFVNVP